MCNYQDHYELAQDGYNIPEMRSFKQTDDSDIDYRKYERTFSGRMTKKRWQIIDRFCRVHNRRPRYRCGHDYDCCGCLCGQYLAFEYKHNAVTVYLQHTYNY